MNNFLGITIVLTETMLYALMGPILKKANLTLPPFTLMTITTFMLSILSIIMSLAFEHPLGISIPNQKSVLFYLLIYSLINLPAFWLLIQGYKYMSLSQQSLFALLSPIFVAIFAFIILGEKFDPKILISLLIMSIGLVFSFI
jgi:drug/metabolite transporter (DMT)-like permease